MDFGFSIYLLIHLLKKYFNMTNKIYLTYLHIFTNSFIVEYKNRLTVSEFSLNVFPFCGGEGNTLYYDMNKEPSFFV